MRGTLIGSRWDNQALLRFNIRNTKVEADWNQARRISASRKKIKDVCGDVPHIRFVWGFIGDANECVRRQPPFDVERIFRGSLVGIDCTLPQRFAKLIEFRNRNDSGADDKLNFNSRSQ